MHLRVILTGLHGHTDFNHFSHVDTYTVYNEGTLEFHGFELPV